MSFSVIIWQLTSASYHHVSGCSHNFNFELKKKQLCFSLNRNSRNRDISLSATLLHSTDLMWMARMHSLKCYVETGFDIRSEVTIPVTNYSGRLHEHLAVFKTTGNQYMAYHRASYYHPTSFTPGCVIFANLASVFNHHLFCVVSVSLQRLIQYLASRNTLFNLHNFLDKGALQGKTHKPSTCVVQSRYQLRFNPATN